MSRVSFETFANVIDGELRHGEATAHAIDPSTGKDNWTIPVASAKDLDHAVASAKKAFVNWSKTSWAERAEKVGLISKILMDYKEEMIHLLMKEAGKPYFAAEIETEHAGLFFDFYAKQNPLEDKVIQDDETLRLTERHAPLGVVGAITPFNFPLVLAAGKIAAALLTGNCIIVKPSKTTPYSVLKLAELAQSFLPAGVFQAISGESTLGPLMTTHEGIAKITFTGSTGAGKKIMAAASGTLKTITLELGGNSPSIICSDVDVAKIVPEVLKGAFFNSGQFCLAAKRIYVHEDIYREFVDEFVTQLKSWKTGSVYDKDTILGPVQNKMQYDVILDIIEDCKRNGYKFALEGGPSEGDGYVIQPSVVDNPPDNAVVVTEEPFGPIVPIQSWKTEDEVISRVNNTLTGLGGAVWSADLDRAERLADRVESGTIWINHSELPLPQAHLSGWKESGLGGEWGRTGLLSYCQTKVVHKYKTNAHKL